MTETVYISADWDDNEAIDELVIEVDDISYSRTSGYFDARASCPDEFYGSEDLDYSVVSIIYVNEDGDECELSRELTNREYERLEEAVLVVAREQDADDYDNLPCDDDYDGGCW